MVIFDLDGVLAETETVSFQILKKYIEPDSVDWDDYEKLIGKGGKSFAKWLKTHFKFEGTVDEIQNNANTFLHAQRKGNTGFPWIPTYFAKEPTSRGSETDNPGRKTQIGERGRRMVTPNGKSPKANL